MVGACETLVAVLTLVWPHAGVDPQVVLQVVVVHKLGVAVEADVGALTCVLPHVDLEFVLSEKRRKKNVIQFVARGKVTSSIIALQFFTLLALAKYK